MLYAAIGALGALPSVAQSSLIAMTLYPYMLVPQSDKSMKSASHPTFATIIVFYCSPSIPATAASCHSCEGRNPQPLTAC
jgi:hypothetical protein